MSFQNAQWNYIAAYNQARQYCWCRDDERFRAAYCRSTVQYSTYSIAQLHWLAVILTGSTSRSSNYMPSIVLQAVLHICVRSRLAEAREGTLVTPAILCVRVL